MKRHEIRVLKRAVTGASNKDAMLTLLERSVRFGHKKLALLRCIQAERLGVPLPPEILLYCQEIADQLPVEVLQRVIMQSTSKNNLT